MILDSELGTAQRLSARSTLQEAFATGGISLTNREKTWLDKLSQQAEAIPDDEAKFIEAMRPTVDSARCLLAEYEL